MDEASDYGHKEQVCIVIYQHFVIQGRLVDFKSTESTTSDKLFQILIDSLRESGLLTDGLIGQCYEGASNMKGCCNGLQAKVKEMQPKALYSHCYAHWMNLV